MQVFVAEGQPLVATTLLQNMERLAQEARDPPADLAVNWQAHTELRSGSGVEADIWLYLQATLTLPLTCQRCMGEVDAPIIVNQWYRFVATEEIAMAEDDQSEEDLLVMTPQFDLLSVLEDELLMALPLVPMHNHCPVPLVLGMEIVDLVTIVSDKPNPFAALAEFKLKKQVL